MAALARDKTTRRWWELTDPCQEPVDSAARGERWTEAVEVFHTDGWPRLAPSPGEATGGEEA